MRDILLLIFSIVVLNIGYSLAKLCNNDDIIKIFIIMGLISILLYPFLDKKNESKWWDKRLIMSAICILLGYYIFISLIQKNSITKYMVYGNVLGILLISFIGIYYFKEKLSYINILGICIVILGIYLLSLK